LPAGNPPVRLTPVLNGKQVRHSLGFPGRGSRSVFQPCRPQATLPSPTAFLVRKPCWASIPAMAPWPWPSRPAGSAQQVQFSARDAARLHAKELRLLLAPPRLQHESTPLAALVFCCLGRGQGLLMASRMRRDASAMKQFPALPHRRRFCNGGNRPVAGTTYLAWLHASWAFWCPHPAGPGGGRGSGADGASSSVQSAQQASPHQQPRTLHRHRPSFSLSAPNPFTRHRQRPRGPLPCWRWAPQQPGLELLRKSRNSPEASLTAAERDARASGASAMLLSRFCNANGWSLPGLAHRSGRRPAATGDDPVSRSLVSSGNTKKRRVLQPALLHAIASAPRPGRRAVPASDVAAVIEPMVALSESLRRLRSAQTDGHGPGERQFRCPVAKRAEQARAQPRPTRLPGGSTAHNGSVCDPSPAWRRLPRPPIIAPISPLRKGPDPQQPSAAISQPV